MSDRKRAGFGKVPDHQKYHHNGVLAEFTIPKGAMEHPRGDS